jgi:hypothetical protein
LVLIDNGENMKLPKLNTPTYTLTLPSTGKSVKYRPFLVKEEKILLIAGKTEDSAVIVENLNTVLRNCILSTEIDVDKLTAYDAQWIFLKLREVSMGSKIDAKVKCPITQKYFDAELSLENASLNKPEKRINKIVLDVATGVGVVLRDLSLSEIYSQIELAKTDEYKAMLNLLAMCVVDVFDKDNVYPASESSLEEVVEFLENLSKEQFDKINDFFENTPKIRLEEDLFSPHAQQHIKLVLDNFMDFFG